MEERIDYILSEDVGITISGPIEDGAYRSSVARCIFA